MRTVRALLLAASILATTACASNTIKHQAAALAAEIQPTLAGVVVSPPDVPPALALTTLLSRDATRTIHAAAQAYGIAAAEDRSQIELDADAMIDTQELVRDPWESFNRKVHSFNNAVDEFVLQPVVVG